MKSFVLVFLLVLASCENKLEKIKKDGFQCGREGGGVGFVAKDNQHCFSCPTDEAMLKCATNPLTSGCTEQPCKR